MAWLANKMQWLMLVSEPARRLVLSVAVLSKSIFIGLVLTFGRELLAYQVGVAVAVDAVLVVVFGGFLLGTRHPAP